VGLAALGWRDGGGGGHRGAAARLLGAAGRRLCCRGGVYRRWGGVDLEAGGAPAHAGRDSRLKGGGGAGFLPCESISLRDPRDVPPHAPDTAPRAVQGLAACVAAPDRRG